MRRPLTAVLLGGFVLASLSLLGLNGYLLLTRYPESETPPLPPHENLLLVSGPAPTQPTITAPATLTEAAFPAAAPTAPPANTPAQPPSPTALPSPTATATVPALPSAARVDGLRRSGQVYPLSCEAHIAVTLAGWYGVSLDEKAFQAALPLSDNPEEGFVGDVHGSWGQTPPNDYGVHAPPVAALLRAYGVPAQARRGMTWQELRAEIAAGHPVGVWVAGHVGRGAPLFFTAEDGTLVAVARFEHTVIVIGYTPAEVTIQDGAGIYTRNVGDFLRSWSVLGNMALTISPPPQPSP